MRKEKEGALIAIMQDGMKVTANNRQAWIEICTCPLSLVCTQPAALLTYRLVWLPDTFGDRKLSKKALWNMYYCPDRWTYMVNIAWSVPNMSVLLSTICYS